MKRNTFEQDLENEVELLCEEYVFCVDEYRRKAIELALQKACLVLELDLVKREEN